MTDYRFSHAIADGEGISIIAAVEKDGVTTLAVSDDSAAVASVADYAAAGGLDGREIELAVRVRDEEELERALEELDPELLVLAGTLDDVLELLQDVPAGKLAIAELLTPTEDDIDTLERAGMDAVIVREGSLS